MKAVVAAFNQEKALVGAFSVIMNLRMQFGCNFLKHYLGAGVGEEGGVAPRHALVQVQLHRHEALLAAVGPPVASVEVWFEVLARGVLQEAEPLVETDHLVVVPGGGDELLD